MVYFQSVKNGAKIVVRRLSNANANDSGATAEIYAADRRIL